MQPFAVDPLSGLSVDSSAFRRRAPQVQLSNDPDRATAETVAEMCRQIHEAAKDPNVQRLAWFAADTIRGGPAWVGSGVDSHSPRVMAESCWWWCKTNLKFQHHSGMFSAWARDLGDPRTKMQLLISPSVLIRMSTLKGDCAVYTEMLAAMLEVLGVHWEICTGAVDASQPDIFSHVWPRAVFGDGGREPLDASHGKYPGWQVPSYDIHRLKVWSSSGNEVADQARRFTGLHDYRRSRGLGRCRGYGMGDFCDDNPAECGQAPILQPDSTIDLSTLYPVGSTSPAVVNIPTAAGNQPGFVIPPQSNPAAWAALGAALKGAVQLATLQNMPAGTVVNPNGQIIRQAPGYAVPVGTGTNVISPFGSASFGSVLPWLAIGALGLFAVSRH